MNRNIINRIFFFTWKKDRWREKAWRRKVLKHSLPLWSTKSCSGVKGVKIWAPAAHRRTSWPSEALREIRSIRWKFLPITFLTGDLLHRSGKRLSKFLKLDLCHFQVLFHHTLFLTVKIYWSGCEENGEPRSQTQPQIWHITLMRSNFLSKTAALLSSIRTPLQ